jgi:hypothetical protein
MDWLLQTILVIIYIFWLPVMLLGRAFGRDPLQLKDPKSASYWVVRQSQLDPGSYSSEASKVEGAPAFREGGPAGPQVGATPYLLSRLLRGFASLFGPTGK